MNWEIVINMGGKGGDGGGGEIGEERRGGGEGHHPARVCKFTFHFCDYILYIIFVGRMGVPIILVDIWMLLF